MKYIFGLCPSSRHKTPKSLVVFLSDVSNRNVFCSNEATFVGLLESSRVGVSVRIELNCRDSHFMSGELRSWLLVWKKTHTFDVRSVVSKNILD